MKKTVFVVLALFAAGVVVFAGGGRQAPSGGPVTINFHTASDMSREVDPLVTAFNARNNGFQVKVNYTPNNDYDDKIKVLVSGSSDVDAFWIRNPAPVQQYISNNALKELTPYMSESGLDLTPIRDSTLKGAAKDGKYYGLPTTGSCWMIYYNKDLFDARGIPYPVNLTWDQYLDLAKQLTYTEGGKKYWGGVCPPWVLNLGAVAGAEYLTAAEPMPLTRQYSQVLHRMYVDDHSHPDIGEMSVGTFDINSFFAAGNVYMMINGDWTFSLLETPFQYGAAPLPVFPGLPNGSSAGSVGFFAVSARSAHPQEAYKFIEWALTSGEGTAVFANAKAIPAYPTKDAQDIYQRLVSVPGVEYRFSSIINQEQTTEPYYDSLADAFRQEIELYLLGEQDLNKAFSNFYTLRKEIIDNFR
ncbi:MAG: sugar ABC transporter substrate-binding protein [Treponema sp.]|jgi:ABC-type glycerol-3-phosphate transport system substrate-binding protein|nr:sugar ABC transporter substrate-binding protein [Treponema sp.]